MSPDGTGASKQPDRIRGEGIDSREGTGSADYRSVEVHSWLWDGLGGYLWLSGILRADGLLLLCLVDGEKGIAVQEHPPQILH